MLGFQLTNDGFMPVYVDIQHVSQSFTGPTHFISANIQEPASFKVSL